MQIHELNNFTGTLGAGAYLAVDDGNDTGKLSTQQLLAATEARIDNIIAGPAPSAEEIVDARLGADGVTYSSLGTSIRSQVTDLKSELSLFTGNYLPGSLNLIDILSTGTSEAGKYVDGRNGAYISNTTCNIVKDIDVSADAGDMLFVRYYSYYFAGFAFYDANHTFISGSENRSLRDNYTEMIAVPQNAKYLSVTLPAISATTHFVFSYAESMFEKAPAIQAITKRVDNLSPSDVYMADWFVVDGEVTEGKAWQTTGEPTTGANYKYAKYSLADSIGDTLKASGMSWGTLWPLASFYDNTDKLLNIYGTSGSTKYTDAEIQIPTGASYVIINGSPNNTNPAVSLYKKTGKTQADFNSAIGANYLPRLYSLQDAFVAWMNGEKFPIAFYGDSTTDGWRTTGWTANTLGSDHTTGYLYTDVLQAHLRECCNNSILRVYNAGFTGRTISWAVSNFEAEFINSGVAYSDVKMIGISFGINDAIGNKSEYTAFKNNLIALIEKCINNNIQPFLVTTQATYEEDPTSRNETIANHSYANQIKKEVARQYNLELIDTEKHTSRFITWSQQRILDIIPDTCHFADAGHNFEGGMYFWQIVPRTIYADESGMIVTPYTIGVTSDIGWRDGNYGMLFANNQGSNSFKTVIEVARENPTDIKMLDTWVYFNRPMGIKPIFGTLGSQYVIVDGASISPNSNGESIGTFDMGLHHIVLMSGTDETVRCYGYKLV